MAADVSLTDRDDSVYCKFLIEPNKPNPCTAASFYSKLNYEGKTTVTIVPALIGTGF